MKKVSMTLLIFVGLNAFCVAQAAKITFDRTVRTAEAIVADQILPDPLATKSRLQLPLDNLCKWLTKTGRT